MHVSHNYATQSKVSFLATKFGSKLRKTTPRKYQPAEKIKKDDQDSPIPTLNLRKDAEKRKYFSDHSQGSPSKRQNMNFKITKKNWVGKSRSEEQQHLLLTNHSAAQKSSSVCQILQTGGLSYNDFEVVHKTEMGWNTVPMKPRNSQ